MKNEKCNFTTLAQFGGFMSKHKTNSRACEGSGRNAALIIH